MQRRYDYRRKLPHLQPDCKIFFITFSTSRRWMLRISRATSSWRPVFVATGAVLSYTRSSLCPITFISP
jgi:hypothetical protein